MRGVFGAVRNLVVLGLIAWGAWTLWQWQFAGGGGADRERAARESCTDEARRRFDVTAARSHSVRANSSGYVVRGSMTLTRGGTARLTCLTNHNGRVTEIMVDE